MLNVYALKLKSHKFYIGSTKKSVHERFEEHTTGIGSEWTNLYQPLAILEILENADRFDEDKLTKKYMNLYGIDNVRGGSYTAINLPDFQLKALEMELSTSKNRCFKCLQVGHYANNCAKLISHKSTNHNYPVNSYHRKQGYQINNYYSNNQCWRCGRSGHWSDECFAKTDVYGYKLW